MKKLNSKAKKTVISVSAGAAAVAIVAGIVSGLRGRGEPVGVYPFPMVGMTEFWGDNQESYGPVTTDRIQTVFLSDTQTITEVLVSEGDTVKKGDVLMTYDTTLSELELERKRLDVEKANLQVKEAQEELARINQLEPMGDVDFDFPSVSTDYGREISEKKYEIHPDLKYDGSSEEKPLVVWVSADKPLDNSLLKYLYATAVDFQIQNTENVDSSASAMPEDDSGSGTKDQNAQDDGSNPLGGGDNQTPSGGDNQTTGGGDNQTPSGGNNQTPGSGDNQTPGSGDNQTPGSGDNQTPGSGDNQTPGGGDNQTPGGGDNQSPGGGDNQTPGGEDNQTPGGGDNQTPGGGDNNDSAPEDPYQTAISMFIETAPLSLRISCKNVGRGQTFTVQKGNAVNLFFSTDITDPIHKQYVKWTVESSPAGPLQGMNNGYGNYTLSCKTDNVEDAEYKYKVTAEYKADGVTVLSDIYEFTLSVQEKVEQQEKANDFYMVLRVTSDDKQYTPQMVWQGIHVTVYDGGSFGFQLYDAAIADPFAKEEEEISFPEIDFGSGMTAAEIAKLRKDQEKKIKELSASAKMTESEYNLMEREFNDGSIRATLDGEVVSLITEEESRQNRLPMMKVSGGGGFYVQGSVSELEKDNLKLGQEVSINDWNTGMMYTGTVESIGDFPTQDDGWNGMGNPNASYYPFRVFIDGTADLQEGSYVSVTYSAAEAENGVYLENPFLRTDDGEPYVYVRGKNGRLEKRTVTTGKSLWGSYTEIRSGLTADDYVAFPYGKNAKPGAATEESDLSALYGY